MSDEQPVGKVINTKTNEENRDYQSSGSSFFSGLLNFLMIVVIIAVGAVGYFGYNYWQQFSARLTSIEQQGINSQTETKETIAALGNEFSLLLQQTQQKLDQQNASNEKNLADISAQISDTRRKLQSVRGRHQNDWMLAEADYLVRIASNRLLLEHDYSTALVLLVNADERIMMMDDPSLQPVREALSRDMATLRLVKRADIAGLAIRINSLIPQLKVLPALAFQLPEEIIKEIDTSIPVADISWQQSLKNTLKELSVKWFEVRNHGRPVTPLMAPETETMLLTNMTLLLQTTQFATLRQHSELYHHSLQQLKEVVNEYYDTADPVVIAFVNEVDLLNATSVQEDLPTVLESRLIIAREMERRVQQEIAPKVIEEPVDVQQ